MSEGMNPRNPRTPKRVREETKNSQSNHQGWNKFLSGVRFVGSLTFKLRSVLLAIPVAVAAIALAIKNNARLPAEVGLNMQASGEYAQFVSRNLAVMGPLAVTAVCLLMMFCSRRVVYPWLISLFSLILPIFIWFTNVYPN